MSAHTWADGEWPFGVFDSRRFQVPWLCMAMAAARRSRHERKSGHWGGWRSSFRGRGPRVRRGEVRIAILFLLDDEPMHGYQIIQELKERSGGVWTASPGSVYPTLQQLEDEGLIESSTHDKRRVYSLTDEGRDHLAVLRERQPPPWEDLAAAAGDQLSELRRSMFQLGAASLQIAHAGSSEDVEKAQEILDQARRNLYRLLADDETGKA